MVSNWKWLKLKNVITIGRDVTFYDTMLSLMYTIYDTWWDKTPQSVRRQLFGINRVHRQWLCSGVTQLT